MSAVRTLAFLFVSTSGLAAQTATTVDALVHELLKDGKVHLSGKQDTADNFDVFRLGFTLWDTNEKQGGYWSEVQQLNAHGSDIFPLVTPPGGAVNLSPANFQHYFDYLFTKEWINFSEPDRLQLLSSAYSNLNLLSVQNTIFCPQRASLTAPMTFYEYPQLDSLMASLPAAPQYKLIQDIGFANNPVLATGEYDFNFAHPLVARQTLQAPIGPSLAKQRADESDDFPALDPHPQDDTIPDEMGFWHYPMNMAYPEVASLLAASIVERVHNFGDAVVDYNAIGGEFFFSGDADLPAAACDDLTVYVPPDYPPNAYKTAYKACLPLTDYSPGSLVHFRHWLARKYNGLADLESAAHWGVDFSCTGSIKNCTEIDPSVAAAIPGVSALSLQRILDDWIEFQAHQQLEAEVFQYNVAKKSNRNQSMYLLSGEHSALYTDGFSSNMWWGLGTGSFQPGDRLSPPKATTLRANTYGESVNFPQFAMYLQQPPPSPQQIVDCTWCFSSVSSWPQQWRPFPMDVTVSMRTLREFLALGVDALGVAYFENGFNFNVSNAAFVGTSAMLQVMGQEASDMNKKRAFMTPWRSPLLVHQGAVRTHDDALRQAAVSEGLLREQVQYAPYSVPEALEDLWVTSARDVLLVPFVDIDTDDLLAYQAAANANKWNLVVLTDAATYNGLLLDPSCPDSVCSVPNGYGIKNLKGPGVSCNASLLWQRIYYFCDTSETFIADTVAGTVLPFIESLSTHSLRPVRARDPATQQDLDDVDLSVSCDGINFLAAVTNAGAFAQSVKLHVDTSFGIYGDVTTPQALLVGQTALLYLPMRFPAHAIPITFPNPNLGDRLKSAVDVAWSDLTGPNLNRYDTKAGKQLHAQFGLFSYSPTAQDDYDLFPEKILAGLLRLERMPFVKFQANAPLGLMATITVRTLHTDADPLVQLGLVAGATVQVEFMLHHHARETYAAVTAPNGTAQINLVAPADQTTWDFVNQDYVSNGCLVEVNVQHPKYKSQCNTVKDGQDAPMPF